MISWLEGVLMEAGTTAIVRAGGLGLAVQLPARSVAQLPPVGATVRLWTHLAVREDGWTLYGFPTREEVALFRLLIGVSGVGPKLALGVLSGAAPAEVARCLRAADERALSRLPGIGRKTAARLIVELGQRLPAELLAAAGTAGDTAGGDAGAEGAGAAAPAGTLGEALAVLTALGLPAARAEQALQAARARDPEAAAETERWVRLALREL